MNEMNTKNTAEETELTGKDLEQVSGGMDGIFEPGYQTVPTPGGNQGYFGKPGESPEMNAMARRRR